MFERVATLAEAALAAASDPVLVAVWVAVESALLNISIANENESVNNLLEKEGSLRFLGATAERPRDKPKCRARCTDVNVSSCLSTQHR